MNIYKGSHVSKQAQTPEFLANEAWHFSNSLAAGRWNQKQVEKVELTRLIVETLYDEEMTEATSLEPIYNEVVISFSALKRFIKIEDGDYLLPHYTITSSTSQGIDREDIPEHVLDEIFEDAKEEDHPSHDLLDDAGIEGANLSPDNLGTFDLQRMQQVEYEIDHDGNIEDYSISYMYNVDDVMVHEVGYTQSMSEIVWQPVRLANGEAPEGKPIVIPILNEHSIESDVRDFDSAYEEFTINQFLRKVTEYTALPREEHTRRILGMLSMVSGGFVDLRK